MKARARAALLVVALLAPLAGCTLGPDYQRPVVPTPATWRSPAEMDRSLADLRWWELFRDEAVRSLVAAALEENKNAGRNRARLDGAEARREQALIQYEQAIQQAFREVEDTLVAHRKSRDVRREQEALVEAARRAGDLADLRYRNGLATYLEVLDAQRQLFAAEIGLAQTHRAQLVAVVQVYKALGGGWLADEVRRASRAGRGGRRRLSARAGGPRSGARGR